MANAVVNKYILSRYQKKPRSNLAERTTEVRAVGAWAHPEAVKDASCQSAVQSAYLEEDRIHQIQESKEAKLRHFQDEVRKRVQTLQRIKVQQQLVKSYKAVEAEHNIIKQSSTASEKSSSRKNWCKLRANNKELSIHHSAATQQEENLTTELENDIGLYEEQSNQVHQFTQAARQNLISRKVIDDEELIQELPGGMWKSGATRDHPASRTPRDYSLVDGGASHSSNVLEGGDSALLVKTDQVHVQTHDIPIELNRKHSARKYSARSTSAVSCASSVPDIYPGVENAEEKQQAITQRALYRRLFMDIEREQVREAIRRKEHKIRIEILKKEKEEERKRVELASLRSLQPSDPWTGQTYSEIAEREQLELEYLEQSQREYKKKLQRTKESERFLNALKSQLREKMEKRNVELPALCCCGDSIWDTNPDTCANNCVFYKNPKAYTKALQCVLASCEAV